MLFREEDEDLEALPFADRTDAGRILASKLSGYSGRKNVVVLGLSRGGMPVAAAVAGVLRVPLDVLVVIKVGTPWNTELAMGAVAEGDVQVLNLSMVNELCVSDQDVEGVTSAARRELEIRERIYRCGHPPFDLQGTTVILVDDGIATGCSILAAITAVRRRGATRVVVGVPVAPASGYRAIQMEADEVISVAQPDIFLAVSQWYRDFTPVSDEDVQWLLENTMSPMPSAA